MKFDGVHLTSQQSNQIAYAKQNNLYTIISCHNEEEILKAKYEGANAITYSPIFYKEDKDHPKGCENLKKIIEKYQDKNFRIIALGGIINNTQIGQVKNTNCAGFASIRYFTN
jgi:thiamine-phosphate pyrophosphorylase